MDNKNGQQNVELQGMFDVTIVFRWATILHVLIILSTGAEIAVPLSVNFALFYFAVLMAIVITIFRRKIFYLCYSRDIYLWMFLAILLTSDFLLMTYGGGWRNSWYVYTFGTVLVASVFKKTLGGLVAAAILSVIYILSLILNGISLNALMTMDILEQAISNCISYILAGGIFSYPPVILERLHKTNVDLREKTEQLGEAQELLDHLKKHSKDLTEAIKETLITRNLLDKMPSDENMDAKIENGKSLSEREKEILKLIVDGYTTSEISNRLNLSTHTVDTHRKSIYKKMDVNNSAQAIIKALRENIVSR